MEDHGIDVKLPLNTPVEINFTPSKSGELRYGCAMGKMISGVFLVE
jgi:plastocyanin domain-containing protein